MDRFTISQVKLGRPKKVRTAGAYRMRPCTATPSAARTASSPSRWPGRRSAPVTSARKISAARRSDIPIEDAGETLCTDDVCTDEQCCVSGGSSGNSTEPIVEPSPVPTSGPTDGQTGGTDGTLYCNSIGCSDGFIPIPMAWETECTGDVCTEDQCCEAFCAFYACPDGKTPVEGASELQCTDDVCTEEQCCEAFCSYHPCPGGYTPIEDAGETLCTDDVCTDEQCCVFVG
ncbi:unnamed protein product [Scytosiphon promiscuus]